MKLFSIYDSEFKEYGQVLNVDPAQYMSYMDSIDIPDDVFYKASDSVLEAMTFTSDVQNEVYGYLPIRVGYCIGHNDLLNALEYHSCSEVNIAITDAIFLLGRRQDITTDGLYDTQNVVAFFVPRGAAVEIFATTLHFAPCGYQDKGFKVIVILPAGVNDPLPVETSEGDVLSCVNKWVLAHPEYAQKAGHYVGLVGANVSVRGISLNGMEA